MGKQPHLQVEDGDINDIVLLPGDPGRVDRIAEQCEAVTEVARNREYTVVNATFEGVELTIASTGIGSPSAAIAVEELQRVGAETLIRVGTIGALQADIEVGDMIVATGAAKDEGTSKRYESASYPAVPDHEVLGALVEAAERTEKRAAEEASADAGSRVHVGPIVTDDAFYAESEAAVEDWEAAGLLAVEMEAAAIFTLARRRGLAAGAICTVDGNLIAGTQKGEGEQELPAKARNNVERAITISLEAVRALAD